MVKKACVFFFTLIWFAAVLALPYLVCAQTNIGTLVDSIIADQQDSLILATISAKNSTSYTVEVMEEIGTQEDKDNTSSSANKLVGKEIEVTQLTSYTGYSDYEYPPKIGDNLLLSLTFNGNTYAVKNGAFRVDYTSHDTFNFIVPESMQDSEEAMEITALYMYVRSNAFNTDITLKDGVIYTHDTMGSEKVIDAPMGIKYLNEDGETTKTDAQKPFEPMPAQGWIQENTWIKAVAILACGALFGALFVHLVVKFEKRHD